MPLRRAALLAAAAVSVAALLAWRRRRRVHLMRELCRRLPKAELHCHLSGCARLTTIAELAPAGVDTSALHVGSDDDRSLDACFAIFAAIHKTVTSLAAVERIAWEVLSDFAADNVKYLELRTTPRVLDDADLEGYVRALLGVCARFDTHQQGHPELAVWPMTTRLLLSIDRTGGLDKAMETVELAARLRAEPPSGADKYIVGLDFSGNPTRGTFADYVPAFEAAREAGLKVAAHAAEVDHPADNASILRFRPERLGHALLLSASDVASLRASPIPIELCPTSNLKTLKLRSMRDHPTMGVWLAEGYPVSISTDDSSVFGTSSSKELALVAEALGLAAHQVVQLALAPLQHTFDASTQGVEPLRRAFERESAKLLAEQRARGL
mmetsp:Transcript_11295/g.36108  ORF Transcript_11295/g.36108 Transcript_11295/m.36108 type:complete len:383 (+) Transcript_11295:86-1234(+)